jgi:uncharacterized damage-inducible protein DinB
MNDTILEILPGKSAHVTFQQAVEGTNTDLINKRAGSIKHTLWELVEHIRRAQRDILEFIEQKEYSAPNWPDDYWPAEEGTKQKWYVSIRGFQKDRQALIDIAYSTDLTVELPYQEGYSYLREVLLVAQHTSYHIGQIVSLRRALGDWDRL